MTKQGDGRYIGPLNIGGGAWNSLVDVADAYGVRALGELLPRIAAIGVRVNAAATNAEKCVVAGESNLAIAQEVMVAFMCGFRLAMAAAVVEVSDDETVRFQVNHPEDPCRRTIPSA